MDVRDGVATFVVAACNKVCLCRFAVHGDVMQLLCLLPRSSLAKKAVSRQAAQDAMWLWLGVVDAGLFECYTADHACSAG